VYLDVVGLHNPRGQWTEVRCTMTLGTEVVSRDQCGRSVLDVCRETRQLHTMFLHPGPHDLHGLASCEMSNPFPSHVL